MRNFIFEKVRMGHARPREATILGATVSCVPRLRDFVRPKEYALPWGRSGMAHSCRSLPVFKVAL